MVPRHTEIFFAQAAHGQDKQVLRPVTGFLQPTLLSHSFPPPQLLMPDFGLRTSDALSGHSSLATALQRLFLATHHSSLVTALNARRAPSAQWF
jgi:hypothetical protein